MSRKKSEEKEFLNSSKAKFSKEDALKFFKNYANIGKNKDGITVITREIITLAMKCPNLFKKWSEGGPKPEYNFNILRSVFDFSFEKESKKEMADFIEKLNAPRALGLQSESNSNMNAILLKMAIIKKLFAIKIFRLLEILKKEGIFDPEIHKSPSDIFELYKFIDFVYSKDEKNEEKKTVDQPDAVAFEDAKIEEIEL